MYFPITAAQFFDLSSPPKGTLKNGVYIPYVAALQFLGDYEMKGVCRLSELMVNMHIYSMFAH
jgi:hypothetical protein